MKRERYTTVLVSLNLSVIPLTMAFPPFHFQSQTEKVRLMKAERQIADELHNQQHCVEKEMEKMKKRKEKQIK